MLRKLNKIQGNYKNLSVYASWNKHRGWGRVPNICTSQARSGWFSVAAKLNTHNKLSDLIRLDKGSSAQTYNTHKPAV